MKKIAILGNSLTAVHVIEELKAQGESVEATFISSENAYPYYRHLLFKLPVKQITQNKILYRANTEYEKEKIQFVFDKKITRINFKRGRITLEDKGQIDYDVLLLSDLVQPPFLGLKGANKTGLFNVKRLADMSAFLKVFPVVETLVVQADSLSGLKAVLSFAALAANLAKEVILVRSGKNILGGLLTDADAARLETLLAQQSVRTIAESQITEILGDNDVKAVRLQNGKVFGCQAVLTDFDLPDLRLFKDTELQCDERVLVNEKYQTNFDNVFAADSVCDRITFNDWDMAISYPQLAQEQSRIIVAAILKKEQVVSGPVPALVWDIEMGDEKIAFSVVSEESQTLHMQWNQNHEAVNAAAS